MKLAREIQSYLARKQMATSSEKAIVGSSILTAAEVHMEAMKCFMLEKDEQKIQNPLACGRDSVTISVCKNNTVLHLKKRLEFAMTGPAEAKVRASEECKGVEKCEITASKPGKYQLDVLWNGAHIRGSPFSLLFKLPGTQIYSNELNLQSIRYRLGIAHKFKLDCSELEEGNLIFSVSPPTAARIEIATPPGHPQTYLCKIVPLEIGKHEISLIYSGKHIYGSPFSAEFGYPGDASKCTLSTSTPQHRLGTKVLLQVDTSEAGFGQLKAGVRDIANNKPVDLVVSRTHQHQYMLEFNPGLSLECVLAVKYDDVHITGSPFRLQFNELADCTAEGLGLTSAQAGAWNPFTVIAEKSCMHQGALKVDIHDINNRRVETVVSSRSPLHFDVSYYPKTPGVYTISLQWGEARAPGSPFRVACTSPSLAVADRPTGDVTLGDEICFKVKPLGCVREKGALKINARDSAGKETLGHALWDPDNDCYCCVLKPGKTGKYPVSIKFRDTHIIGSPFVTTVIDPVATPQLVRAWGPGLVGTTLNRNGEFTVDVSRAGFGSLSVSIHGNQDLFDITNTKNSSTGLIHVSYSSRLAGSFLMDVKWYGRPIPLSPFNITVSRSTKREDEVNTLDKAHDIFLGNVTNVGINGSWLQAWRSSGRFKHKHLKGQAVDTETVEDAITYF